MNKIDKAFHDGYEHGRKWLVVEGQAIALRLNENGFKPDGGIRQAIALVEEAGEFIGAFRRWKGMARRTGTETEVQEELADVIITAFVTAQEFGWDINEIIQDKLGELHTRGWRDPR